MVPEKSLPCIGILASTGILALMPPRGKGGTQERRTPKRSGESVRPALPREFIALHKQRRIMDALAELTAEQGYEATKISDIVRRAGVARKTLYDNFEGKEEVFLAAFDAARDEVLRRVGEGSADGDGDWHDQVEGGLAAFLGYVAEQPTLARMCMIEALSATPATTKRYEDALETFVELTRQTLPQDERLPDTIAETLVGGVAWIVYQQIRRGEAERAEDLLPELTEFMMAPYLGAGMTD
jgi:AcrR family transcriptional regulator